VSADDFAPLRELANSPAQFGLVDLTLVARLLREHAERGAENERLVDLLHFHGFDAESHP